MGRPHAVSQFLYFKLIANYRWGLWRRLRWGVGEARIIANKCPMDCIKYAKMQLKYLIFVLLVG
ncbi:hypothetical protein I7I50_07719 [Histoplasma capsulatum G186AR]|uniref:Uncharacterized protein n=1 Tax=Ajellomyces capsulatus TaxID=5037 RepID=A0A8H7YZL8_AJECA|nr:hypothetical protein I7I52_09207 [Histoplasma capsulatum]QSS68343.1 hypothetical protein I7I50_07719 [Histoplasma capsulatum G186AR]